MSLPAKRPANFVFPSPHRPSEMRQRGEERAFRASVFGKFVTHFVDEMFPHEKLKIYDKGLDFAAKVAT